MEEKIMYWYHNLRRLAVVFLAIMLIFRVFSDSYGLFWILLLPAFAFLYALLRPGFQKIQEEDWWLVIPFIIIPTFFLLDESLAIRELLLQFFAISIPIYVFVVARKKQNTLIKERFGVHG